MLRRIEPKSALTAQPLAAAEQVVLLDADVEQQRVGGAEAGAGAEGAGLRLLHVDHDVHAVVAVGRAGGDVDLLEEAEALERSRLLRSLVPENSSCSSSRSRAG